MSSISADILTVSMMGPTRSWSCTWRLVMTSGASRQATVEEAEAVKLISWAPHGAQGKRTEEAVWPASDTRVGGATAT